MFIDSKRALTSWQAGCLSEYYFIRVPASLIDQIWANRATSATNVSPSHSVTTVTLHGDSISPSPGPAIATALANRRKVRSNQGIVVKVKMQGDVELDGG